MAELKSICIDGSCLGNTEPVYTEAETDALLATKQDELTAGANVTIQNNEISATDTTYSEASDTDLGLIKINPDEGVTLNADGQLEIAGQWGEDANTGGMYAPKDREFANVNPYSAVISEAKGIEFNSTKSLGVVTGSSLTCRSAAAGSTEYYVNNTYGNRITCKCFENGFVALDEDNAKAGNIARVLSITVNGEPLEVNSDVPPSGAAYRIKIEVDQTINPESATTKIRGYADVTGFSNLTVGQCVGIGNGANGATTGTSAIIGTKQRNAGGNATLMVGSNNVNLTRETVNPLGATVLGEHNINKCRYGFLAGLGHDSTDGETAVAALGQWSEISADTAFAVGNGTAYNARSNAIEITRDGGIIMKSSGGFKFKLTVDDSGNLSTTPI